MQNKINRIFNINVTEGLKQLPDNSINCCITSPPYYGLRNYGTDPQIFNADPTCKHVWDEVIKPPLGGKNHPDRPSSVGSNRMLNASDIRGIGTKSKFCSKCGAWKGELGLEPHPDLYVQHIADIFDEIKRVLKPDGTVWLNLGDSYNSNASGKYPGGFTGEMLRKNQEYDKAYLRNNEITKGRIQGLKPKDLIGIPWMVAFELRNRGYYLRQDIIWYKRNPVPESAADRCTKAHEYIFLLSKSDRYYFDYKAISEKSTWADKDSRFGKGKVLSKYKSATNQYAINGVIFRDDGMRNKRSVWEVNVKSFKDAHFAVFPENLIIDMVKAGCPESGIVLDPFMGSGTTAVVAKRLSRNYIGFELNSKYVKMAEKRLSHVIDM